MSIASPQTAKSMLIEGPLIAEQEACEIDKGGQAAPPALIGPNSVLQLVDAMERQLGHTPCRIICKAAGIDTLPDGTAMIPESDALHLHIVLNRLAPDQSLAIVLQSARQTADYIIANRIPRLIAALLRALPASLAAPLLMGAIRKHAWTFIGAGRFEPQGSWRFSIDRTEAGDAQLPPASAFEWYGAVFARLYQQLVGPNCDCTIDPASTNSALQCSYRLTRVSAPSGRGRGFHKPPFHPART